MSLIKAIERHSSVSVIGTAKNTGKTTCFNYLVRCLHKTDRPIAITSVGLDGEERDALYDTPKPQIMLYEGMVFVTSEKNFANKEFPTEVLTTSERTTPLGRLITARALGMGKAIISGPSDSSWLRKVIDEMALHHVTQTLVDGAFSRMSLASPAVTDAVILCTGAAFARQLPDLIKKTKFIFKLIKLEQISIPLRENFLFQENGIWLINESDFTKKIASSVFTMTNEQEGLFNKNDIIYVNGAVTERFLKFLCLEKHKNITLIVNDFTKLFVELVTYNRFIQNGGKLKVLYKAKLAAVCTNPTSPDGICFDAKMLQEQMQDALQVPVYDIKMLEKNAK